MNHLLKDIVIRNVAPIRRLYAERERLRQELEGTHPTTVKLLLAHQHIRGAGIEIGAFDAPISVAPGVKVRYLDKFSTEEMSRMFPKAKAVPVDYVDDGETLGTVPDSSQDFVIASHFFEHCQNPIGSLKNLLRVTRIGGVIFLVIPDKRFTFDSVRAITPFQHLLEDYEKGPSYSQRVHCEEWARVIDKLEDPAEIQSKTQLLIDTNWPIHFHVWSAPQILEMFYEIRKMKGFSYDIEAFHEDRKFEVTIVMRRTA
jgi:ubiquinone/menaquinone biosynthesis C-methylase UbiE